ncbi:phasin family protein [Azorhizobium doebereinerae]|uniref:phasin family protein n=1 Tax=Azorhizobium doebereinerae TaxID=281091 RepID=UPI00040FEC1D|nr:phasin family protein [Azorhizobium doebereinerae]
MTPKFGPDLELPAELRAIAEKNVAQARQAFDTLFDTAREAVGESEGRLEEVRSGLRGLRQKTLGLVESNFNASFEFLNKLVQAKSPQEVLTLQTEFLSRQMQAVTEQATALGSDARSLGETTVRSLDEHARALADRVKALGALAAQQAHSTAADVKSAGEAASRDVQATTEQAAQNVENTFDPNRTY